MHLTHGVVHNFTKVVVVQYSYILLHFEEKPPTFMTPVNVFYQYTLSLLNNILLQLNELSNA